MPSTPITARTLYWERLNDATIQIIDWALVSTSLGVMVEPRSLVRGLGGMRDEDLVDSSYSDMAIVPAIPTGNYAFDQAVFSASHLWPHLRADDPGVQ